jgi:hypothetical protein
LESDTKSLIPGLTNTGGSTFSVGDTMPRLTHSIEQDNQTGDTKNIIFSLAFRSNPFADNDNDNDNSN